MANDFYNDNDDLRFYVDKWIDWEPLYRLTEADGKAEGAPKSLAEAVDFYKETLGLVGGFVADEIAPHAAQLDREAVEFVDGEAVFPARLQGIFDQIKQ